MITPWIDDGRRLPPDLTKPAAPNFWRFEGMDRLLTLYKAAWRLKDKTPKSLLALKAEMLDAVEKDADAQTAAVSAYESRILGHRVRRAPLRRGRAAEGAGPGRSDRNHDLLQRPYARATLANNVVFNVKLLNRLTNGVTATVRTAGPRRCRGKSGPRFTSTAPRP